MLGVITAVQVAGLVTAAVLINDNDSRQAGKTATGSVRSTDHDGTVGATGPGFARGQEQLKPQADVVELIGQVSLLDTADADVDGLPITLSENVVDMDLTANRPFPFGALHVPSPAGAAVGTQNGFMSVSPDVVNPSINSAIGTILTSFTPGEPVQFFIKGSLAATGAADSHGRFGATITAHGRGLCHL